MSRGKAMEGKEAGEEELRIDPERLAEATAAIDIIVQQAQRRAAERRERDRPYIRSLVQGAIRHQREQGVEPWDGIPDGI